MAVESIRQIQVVAPIVAIKEDAHRKIMSYAALCEDEISALGTVVVSHNKITITDVYLFDQTVSPSSTDLSSESISKFIYEYVKDDKDISNLKFWWHSHARMGVFWSGTDTATIERFSSAWMVSIVSNKNRDVLVRLDVFEPFRYTFDHIPLIIEYNTDIDPAIVDEINEKVRHSYYSAPASVVKNLFSPPPFLFGKPPIPESFGNDNNSFDSNRIGNSGHSVDNNVDIMGSADDRLIIRNRSKLVSKNSCITESVDENNIQDNGSVPDNLEWVG